VTPDQTAARLEDLRLHLGSGRRAPGGGRPAGCISGPTAGARHHPERGNRDGSTRGG
jgi:hypothetical protein